MPPTGSHRHSRGHVLSDRACSPTDPDHTDEPEFGSPVASRRSSELPGAGTRARDASRTAHPRASRVTRRTALTSGLGPRPPCLMRHPKSGEQISFIEVYVLRVPAVLGLDARCGGGLLVAAPPKPGRSAVASTEDSQ